MELLPLLDGKDNLIVLDLGCRLGRNSIPIAEKIKDKGGKVVCVDLLDSAIEKLEKYIEEFGVENIIETELADLGHYHI
jgi:predicted O-methyltransferase YrrM